MGAVAGGFIYVKQSDGLRVTNNSINYSLSKNFFRWKYLST